MSALDDALDAALRVPPKQLPAVVAALLDLRHTSGGAVEVSTEVPALLRIAATTRFEPDRLHVENLLAARTSPELRIASLVVAAPALGAEDWDSVDSTTLAATMPLVPGDVARAAVHKSFSGDLDLAEILASASPFIDGSALNLARQRSIQLGNDDVRKATVKALDTSEPAPEFRQALGANANWFPALEWWADTDTDERLKAVEQAIAGDPDSDAKLDAAIDDALQKLGTMGGWTHGKPPFDGGREVSPVQRGDAPRKPPRVSIGFAAHDAPNDPLERPLTPDTAYWLWFEIAPHDLQGAIRGGQRDLPRLAQNTELDVVLFDFDGQLAIDDKHRRGAVRLVEDHSEVVTAAASPHGIKPSTRLFFAIHAPTTPGKHGVRVCVYHRGALLQSHVVTAVVGEPATEPFSLVTDYSLTKQLDVRAFAPADLSILVNVDPQTGTHGFRFFRDATKLAADASIEGIELQTLIGFARCALRLAAWGTTDPWRNVDLDPYRYATPDLTRLTRDLITFAIHGCRLFAQALMKFRTGGMTVDDFRAAMCAPGTIQLSLKQGTTFVFPVSLVYDYPLDPNSTALTICDAFAANVAAGADLAGTPCFAGQCPHYGDKLVVCPSGFWGFRHQIGMPPSLDTGEAAGAVGGTPETALAASISTDPKLVGRAAHLKALATLHAKTSVIDDRPACLSELEHGKSHIEYFYCHGGKTGLGTAFLEVGAPGSDMITAENLIGITWKDPRPLIVLNGCHTTDVSPDQVFALASGFLSLANASGVIGTEITIFEPLASAFGEEFLRRFIEGKEALGEALRNTRLHMLANRNPLGLVYMPLALSNLRLRD